MSATCGVLPLVGQWLYDWQTLISGVLALGAAGGTIWYLRYEFVLQEKNAENLRVRQSMAARAYLPIALSELCHYCEEAFAHLHYMDYRPIPAPPSSALNEIRDNVLFAEKGAALRLAEILQQFQVSRARLERHGVAHQHQKIDRYFDHVVLRYRVDSLYDYARLEVDVLQDEPDLVRAHMTAMNACDRDCVYLAANDRTALADMINAHLDPEGWQKLQQAGSMELLR